MDSIELERRKRVIAELVNDVAQHKRWFKERGIDVSEPGDRECFDIVSRIIRRLEAQPMKKAAV